MSGGYDQLLKSRGHKKRTLGEKLEQAKTKALCKLGDKAPGIIGEFNNLSKSGTKDDKEKQDGMIISLIMQGYSQIQIRSIFGVGGHRMDRLTKFVSLDEEEREEFLASRAAYKPKHAFKLEEVHAVKAHIESFDLEPSYPCAQCRQPLLYFAQANDGDKVWSWKDVYQKYVESNPPGRIMSITR